MKYLRGAVEFEWDEANSEKNWKKHKVKRTECEQIFFDKDSIGFGDVKHSALEDWYLILGQTKKERKLIVSFTIREKKVRIISARDQNRKERLEYEKKKGKSK